MSCKQVLRRSYIPVDLQVQAMLGRQNMDDMKRMLWTSHSVRFSVSSFTGNFRSCPLSAAVDCLNIASVGFGHQA